MAGRRSVVMLVKLITPSTITMITATTTVNGFFTQYLDIAAFSLGIV